MKDKNILICVGIIIYIAMSGIDRFVYHIPNIIYIPVAILGIALILIGFFKDKFKQENFDWDFTCFREFNNCYILLLNSLQTLENTGFIAGELFLIVSLVLYRPISVYELW